jgi:hypothetical protein
MGQLEHPETTKLRGMLATLREEKESLRARVKELEKTRAEIRAEAFEEDAEWHELCASRYPGKQWAHKRGIHEASAKKARGDARRKESRGKEE